MYNNKKVNWNYLYTQIPMWYEDELVGEDVEDIIERQGYISTDPHYQNEKSKQ
jgi:allophanate hydrolase subunit 1